MKKWLLFLLLFACSEKKTEAVLSPETFNTNYTASAGAILLDVRTVEEVNTGALGRSIKYCL
ncbi:MAG: hypothetical protein U5K54_14135 [Cytophagales bacterium]|nr:hypothetical protein [Cytophagales bacterium]